MRKTHPLHLNIVAELLPKCRSHEERCYSAYNEAIATVVRRGAPLATYAIDRRCLWNYVNCLDDDGVESLICFLCARRFPYLAEWGTANDVRWVKPVIQGDEQSPTGTGRSASAASSFMGMSAEDLEATFGLHTYVARYGQCDGGNADLTQHMDEFDDWKLAIPFGDRRVDIVCCPEDRECDHDGCLQGRQCCSSCRMPLCRECEQALTTTDTWMPPAALANDMMIFYAPRELYTMQVTVVEMICASVCITSMICFTLEAKYRNERAGENPFDSKVHMARHRMGARGNATSFPLPWPQLPSALAAKRRRTRRGQAAESPLGWH